MHFEKTQVLQCRKMVLAHKLKLSTEIFYRFPADNISYFRIIMILKPTVLAIDTQDEHALHSIPQIQENLSSWTIVSVNFRCCWTATGLYICVELETKSCLITDFDLRWLRKGIQCFYENTLIFQYYIPQSTNHGCFDDHFQIKKLDKMSKQAIISVFFNQCASFRLIFERLELFSRG